MVNNITNNKCEMCRSRKPAQSKENLGNLFFILIDECIRLLNICSKKLQEITEYVKIETNYKDHEEDEKALDTDLKSKLGNKLDSEMYVIDQFAKDIVETDSVCHAAAASASASAPSHDIASSSSQCISETLHSIETKLKDGKSKKRKEIEDSYDKDDIVNKFINGGHIVNAISLPKIVVSDDINKLELQHIHNIKNLKLHIEQFIAHLDELVSSRYKSVHEGGTLEKSTSPSMELSDPTTNNEFLADARAKAKAYHKDVEAKAVADAKAKEEEFELNKLKARECLYEKYIDLAKILKTVMYSNYYLLKDSIVENELKLVAPAAASAAAVSAAARAAEKDEGEEEGEEEGSDQVMGELLDESSTLKRTKEISSPITDSPLSKRIKKSGLESPTTKGGKTKKKNIYIIKKI